jgi:hypothetical protein
MRTHTRSWLAALIVVMTVISSLALDAQAATAFPVGDPVFPFSYKIDATTHIKKLDQTINITGGSFTGGIDLATGGLVGSIKLPPATFTFQAAGIVPLITATAKIVPTKAVIGHVDLSSLTVTATSTFLIRLVSAYAPGIPVNLVGNSCVTSKAVVVTMKGLASFGSPSTLSGTFTLPDFKTCGLVVTTALNQLLPGPGNTFSATATPA